MYCCLLMCLICVGCQQETKIHKNEKKPTDSAKKISLRSNLEIIDIETGERKVIYAAHKHFEAPNWSPDGTYLIFNSHGKIYRIDVTGENLRQIDTGFATKCNNDHGFSPDGKQIAVSHHYNRTSIIFVLPSQGGTPKQVTEKGPSYWHGWSPDGKTLAYCAGRNGEMDIYTIPVTGGKEKRLTDARRLDDGPDYSPDGKYIYFNSERTGQMRIWRMDADGGDQTQVTFDEQYADWFPHPSPNGKWIVFLSYDRSVRGHPANKEVALRIMPVEGKPQILTKLFGGQGTLNVPSWSPDSQYVAFVSYEINRAK